MYACFLIVLVSRYLHDWSLPNYCPEIFGDVRGINFTMPKFFSKDYFQLIEGNVDNKRCVLFLLALTPLFDG